MRQTGQLLLWRWLILAAAALYTLLYKFDGMMVIFGVTAANFLHISLRRKLGLPDGYRGAGSLSYALLAVALVFPFVGVVLNNLEMTKVCVVWTSDCLFTGQWWLLLGFWISLFGSLGALDLRLIKGARASE